MFGAVIITFVITTLSMTALFLIDSGKKQYTENGRLRKDNDRLNGQISEMLRQDNSRRERIAYDRGLYDGRETDALYRKMLNQYSSGEQATVMMYGDGAERSTKRTSRNS